MFFLDWSIFNCNLSLSYMRWLCKRRCQLRNSIRLTHHLNFLYFFLKFPVLGLVFGIFGARCNTLCVIF